MVIYPKHGMKWSEEETILAYRLYCQIPFSKIDKDVPAVIELANLLGRSPSSVALKMFNLSHFDPELQKRNVNGMKHASKMDELVFQRFSDNWEDLIYEANIIESKLKDEPISLPDDILLMIDKLPEGKTREQVIKQRINQQFFRESVLNSYHQACCITGITEPTLLVASHIKPWKYSNPKTERTNPSNGLCLNAMHDKAFDQGLMTVLPDYTVRFSSVLKSQMDNEAIAWLTQCEGSPIRMPEKFFPGREFLEYHNDVIFIP